MVEKYFFSSAFIFMLLSSGIAASTVDSVSVKLLPSQKLILFEKINQFEKSNKFAEADSLYTLLDRYNALKLDDLRRWVHCRVVLNRYAGGAVLFARILAIEPRFINGVFGQINELLENAPADSMAAALSAFQKEIFSRRGSDTLGIQLWCADFFARHGMDGAEMNILGAVGGTSPVLVQRLLDMARERFRKGFYAGVIPPAGCAYVRATGARLKTDAAGLIWRSYQALHKSDSALFWLERAGGAGISGESWKIDAAALCQRAGRLSDAKAFIKALPPSFSRDTLELRQCLWNGDTRSARERAENIHATWVQHPNETLLWKVRTLLFDGDGEGLSAFFDTVPVAASWPGAKEILDYRFRLQFFQRSKGALSAWSRIEYELFTGTTERALQRLSEQALPPDLTGALRVRIIKEMLVNGDMSAVMRLFQEQGENVDSPEYLFLYAESLLRTGTVDRAENLLLRIISDYSGDVFSEKARTLLAKIKEKSKQ
jgi:hypothetical protein